VLQTWSREKTIAKSDVESEKHKRLPKNDLPVHERAHCLVVRALCVCVRKADEMPSCVLLPSGLCLCKCRVNAYATAVTCLANNPSGEERENRKPKTRDRGREDGNPTKKGGREPRDRKKATGPPPEANHRGGKAKGGHRGNRPPTGGA
jgi:hypothetical protein